MYRHICKYADTCADTCVYGCMHMFKCIGYVWCICTCSNLSDICAYIQIYLHVYRYICTYTDTCADTCMHGYLHMFNCILYIWCVCTCSNLSDISAYILIHVQIHVCTGVCTCWTVSDMSDGSAHVQIYQIYVHIYRYICTYCCRGNTNTYYHETSHWAEADTSVHIFAEDT